MEKSFKFFLIVTLLLGLITILPAPTFFFVALATAFLYAGYSESWNIVGGYAGYTSLGHGALFGLSAYFVALLLHHFGTSPLLTIPLGGLLCIIIAIIITLSAGAFSFSAIYETGRFNRRKPPTTD